MRRIVVIDDCRLTLAIARDILEQGGYEVFTAESGIDANNIIYGAARPDLILLDVEMPMLRGDRKVQLLKKSERSRDIPVVLISNRPAAELAAIARACGADGYLVKPLRKDSLLEHLSRFVP
ncbi:MAG TPA: response regulator [Desulfuromonadales bacterium]|nr:response regulator [Desulfuromonadales bacterium]